MDESFIGTRITELRLQIGISEYQMSLELGKSKSYIQGITSGNSLPSVTQLLEICSYFEMSPAEFFDEGIHDPQVVRSITKKLRLLPDEDLLVIESLVKRLVSYRDTKLNE